ncbi:MFS transporter [Ktedonospora formicarum]|uniref:MFS transporter n=1 Tax=Ktedonospora formicarum TaxID=2778364 RepID=A0A8J3HRT0_9CHLR|nr:MFS transporter [Ktedonospora formicarum]GHO42434.1 hypothetical protein KSX_05970 [Ktedonospora formicarum]
MSFFWRLLPSRDLLRIPALRWLVIARFLGDLFFYSTTIVFFQQQRGLNFTEMFLMESILSWSIWLVDIPTSLWAERIGYARMMLIGRCVGFVGILIFALAHGFWLFALSNVLGGFAIASISGCESGLVYASLPPEQREERGGETFTLLTSASSAGFFLGLCTGSFLGAYSPALAVWVSLLPALLVCFATLRLFHYVRPVMLREEQAHARVRDMSLRVGKLIRAQPRTVFLSVFRALGFAMTNAIFWYNQPFFERAGIPVLWFGPLTALAMGAQLLLLLRLPILQRRLGTRFVLLCSCLVPGLCYVFLPWVSSIILVVFLVMGIVAFSAWQEPVIEQELNRRIPDVARATTLSTLGLTGALAKGGFDPLIGHLGDLGLDRVGLGLGLGLVAFGICVPFLVSRSK